MIKIRSYLVIKDKRRRRLFLNYEQKKRLVMFRMVNSTQVGNKLRLSRRYHTFPRDAAISRMRNHCTLTGKARSVYRDFRLSRHQVRSLALNGHLVGIRKSSF